MGFVRSTVFTGLLGTSTVCAYLAAKNPVLSPLATNDPIWSSSAYKRLNPARNPATQDVCIKRLPLSRIRPELLRKDGDLALAFCRGLWSGWGYAVQRKYLEFKYRGPETADQLWEPEQLAASTYDKGTCITDHFEVVDKTASAITVRCGDSPRSKGPRPSDGLFVISATVDKAHDEVELRLQTVLFSSAGRSTGTKGPLPPWMEELHQWYSRLWSETASWNLLNPVPVLSGLGSTQSTYRLNQIDKVRANGVGDHVSLPQLVVCGDQSVGKSSVLERVTGIPFPRDDGLCTRFPTEIILRHSSEPLRISASIRPSSQRSLQEQKPLAAYQWTLSGMEELPDVISESAKLMGIRGYDLDACSGKKANAFAHDMLRIEISGPVGLHLTIVDLPGLIWVPSDVQTDDDVRMVREIVEMYMASTRTIIMAVVQAGNDVANQRVVQMARKYDSDGGRTVGIITKPDLINKGVEGKIAKLAKNQDAFKLKLGFFLMRNPTPMENKKALSWDETSRLEMEFFSEPAWKEHNPPAERVGAGALRLFLQVLLDSHIEKELPKVRSEMKRQLTVKEKELSSMGIQRRSCSDVRFFLTNISMRFHGLAEAALDGKYAGTEAAFFKTEGMRLRAKVHEANGRFATTMRLHGQLRTVTEKKMRAKKTHEKRMTTHDFFADEDESCKENTKRDESRKRQMKVTNEEMMAWIGKIYDSTRGCELPGGHNHVLLAELFQEQSSRWPSLAQEHVQKVFELVARWTENAVSTCIAEEVIRQQVAAMCQNTLDRAQTLAMEELYKLIADESRHPITYNHYYTDNIQSARQAKQRAAMEEALAEVHISHFPEDYEKLLHAWSQKAAVTADMNERACKEALDELTAYYKVAMKTFVDNVCRQVIERHVMTALPTLFSPSTVATFSDEELLRIGSETESQKTKREELGALVSGLRQSLVDLQSPV